MTGIVMTFHSLNIDCIIDFVILVFVFDIHRLKMTKLIICLPDRRVGQSPDWKVWKLCAQDFENSIVNI